MENNTEKEYIIHQKVRLGEENGRMEREFNGFQKIQKKAESLDEIIIVHKNIFILLNII